MGSGEFWIVAGPNGAGKSTIVSRIDIRRELGQLKILNPDVLAQKLLRESPGTAEDKANLDAVVQMEAEVARCIESGESVLIETVLSTRKYEKHILRARELGRYVGLIYVALASAEQAINGSNTAGPWVGTTCRRRRFAAGGGAPSTIWRISRLSWTGCSSTAMPRIRATRR